MNAPSPSFAHRLSKTMTVWFIAVNVLSFFVWIIAGGTAGVIAGLVAFLMLVVMVLFRWNGNRDLRRLAALEQSSLLARWQHSPKDAMHAAAISAAQRRTDTVWVAVLLLCMGPFVGWWKEGADGIATGIAVGIGLALFSYGLGRAIASSLLQYAEEAPPVTLLFPAAVWTQGTLTEWNTTGTRFVSAEIQSSSEHGPSLLVLRVDVSGRYGTSGRETIIPVPPGADEDARRIMAQWNAQ